MEHQLSGVPKLTQPKSLEKSEKSMKLKKVPQSFPNPKASFGLWIV
jgi:hypothetical protein